MIEEFVAFLKTQLDNQHKDFLNNRVANGNVGKEGYERSVGILEAFKATQSNIDVWAGEFKKSQDR